MRRFHLAPVTADVTPAHIVTHDKDNIRPLGRLAASAAVGQPRQIAVTTSSASRIGLEKCIGGRLKRFAKRGQFFQQIAKRLAKPYAQATCATRTAPEPFSPWH